MAGLGVGVVWCHELDPLCRPGEGLVDVVEAEPETFWAPTAHGGEIRSFLGPALAHLPQSKLLHGVGAPLAGACDAGEAHTRAFARDVADLAPAFVSEHLSFSRFRPHRGAEPAFAGFLLPPLQSAQGAALAVANISRRRAALGGAPLAIETPVSYLPPAPGEWPDGEFVAAVARGADCGILLDLHNVLCNARNGRQSVQAFLDALPLDRVWEIHLAGGERVAGFMTDAHCGLVEPELMDIAVDVVGRLPNLAAIVFEIMPERVAQAGLAAIGRQLGELGAVWAARPDPAPTPAQTQDVPDSPSDAPFCDPAAWESLLGGAVVGWDTSPPHEALADWWRACRPGIDLYRLLVGEGRASAVAVAAPRTTRLLLRTGGGPATRRLLADFWRQAPPRAIAVDEARAFFLYLSAARPELPDLADCIAADERSLAAL